MTESAKKKFIILYLALIICSTVTCGSIAAQEYRTTLVSNIVTAPYVDNSLNLFDYGKNPAWLINDERANWLRISPVFKSTSGEYRRKYDFEENNVYGISFRGLKVLPEGTFLGYATYNLEQRLNVYRTLKYDTYAGEAFFSTDTNSGDFSYKGPSVGAIYSFELIPGLFLGPSLNYNLMNGLKKEYSRARTLLREIEAQIGAAYEFNDDLSAGASFSFDDSQEKIDSRSNDLSVVEIYNFRGETFSIIDRGLTVSQKIRKQNWRSAFQLYLSPGDKLEIAAKAGYAINHTKILIPRGDITDEDDYAEQKRLDIAFQGRYYFSNYFSGGVYLESYQNRSWSRITYRNLLLWDWNVDEEKLGSGVTYKNQQLTASVEFEYSHVDADSNKYIDHVNTAFKSDNLLLKLSVEYELSNGAYINAAFSRGHNGTDLNSGGKDLMINKVKLGFSRIWEDLRIDFALMHDYRSPVTGTFRESLMTIVELKYFSFRE